MSVQGRGGPVVAVLGFHKVGEPPAGGWPSWFYVPEDTFMGFLQQLQDTGWTVIDATTFVHGLVHPDTLPARSALITFDDGSRSVREVALPCLRRFSCPAVLFVPTHFIGGQNTFDAGLEPVEDLCDWSDLRALQASDVSIQSHTVTHRRLSELTPVEQEHELRTSKAVLEEGLGRPVTLIAYPYGDAPHATQPLQTAGFHAGFLYGGGPFRWPPTPPAVFGLPRLAMGPDTDLRAELDRLP